MYVPVFRSSTRPPDQPLEEALEEPCSHCLDTGWVVLTAENDFGELEDYFVLCRKCR
jgi:hypothetical protein